MLEALPVERGEVGGLVVELGDGESVGGGAELLGCQPCEVAEEGELAVGVAADGVGDAGALGGEDDEPVLVGKDQAPQAAREGEVVLRERADEGGEASETDSAVLLVARGCE